MEKKTEATKVSEKQVPIVKAKVTAPKPAVKIDLKSKLLAAAKAKNRTKPIVKKITSTGGIIDIAQLTKSAIENAKASMKSEKKEY